MPPALPLQKDIQSRNPQFAKFYQYLVTDILETDDCSTRRINQGYHASAVKGRLDEYRLGDLKEAVLIGELERLCDGTSDMKKFESGKDGQRAGLDDELKTLIQIMLACVFDGDGGGLSMEEIGLLAPDVERFRACIDEGIMIRVIEERLLDQEKILGDIAALAVRSMQDQPLGYKQRISKQDQIGKQDQNECQTDMSRPLQHRRQQSFHSRRRQSHDSGRDDSRMITTTIATCEPRTERDIDVEYSHFRSLSRYQQSNTTTSTLIAPTQSLTTNPTKTPELTTHLQTLTTQLTTLQTSILPKTLSDLSTSLQSHLATQTTTLQHLLSDIESSKHGVLPRHNQAKAQFLETLAKGLELKSRITVLDRYQGFVRDGGMVELEQNARKWQGELDELNKRGEELRAVLGEYGVGTFGFGRGGNDENDGRAHDFETKDNGNDETRALSQADSEIMKQLGKKYGEIGLEIEAVKSDIERLERDRDRHKVGRLKG